MSNARFKEAVRTDIRYRCLWCKHRFTKSVRKTVSEGKHSTISSVVICPKCNNRLKTWME